MCNFLSGLALPNGDVLALPEYTDSHSDLIEHFGLKDDGREPELQRFVRVEFSPPTLADAADVSKYALTLDEDRTPPWWNGIAEAVRSKMAVMVERMIVPSDKPLLLGGCWILGGHSVVQVAKGARIVVMVGSSRVGEMRGSSRVGEMRESSRVGAMRESSRVGAMRGSSSVGEMWGSSRVGEMWGSSSVGEMRESSRVGAMWGSSSVGAMRESSSVGAMRESSSVGAMRGSSRVGEMWGSSRVGEMWGNSNAPNPPKCDFRNKPGQAS